MRIKLNNATIDLDGLDLDSMDAEDVKSLTRDTARLYPAEALNEALAVFRGSDSSTSLHATLDAMDTIRRDLPDWLTTGMIYEDRAGQERGERPLTDDERRRVVEVVGNACPTCGGQGWYADYVQRSPDIPFQVQCEACRGTGFARSSAPEPAPAIPAQDSGEALVGVMCWTWDGDVLGELDLRSPRIVSEFRDDLYTIQPCGTRWEHARPVALGRPE